MKDFDPTTTKRILKIAKVKTEKIKAVHIAGSNGKGSTTAFISKILIEEGYKTGTYTSPHLVESTERMRINNKKISKKKFAELASYFKELCEKNKIKANYFEITTAMALKYFYDEKTEIAVIEVGLGGRLDATNVLNGLVCVITSISMEHSQYLGKTLSKIAFEKAGIIKRNSKVIVSEKNKGIKTIEKKAHKEKAELLKVKNKIIKSTIEEQEFDIVSPAKINNIKIKLIGKHQCENASLAVSACIALRKKGFKVSEKSIRTGLLKTQVKGRLEIISKKPLIIADCAHNPDGWKKLFDALEQFKLKKIIAVVGAMHDKDVKELGNLLKKINAKTIITKSDSFRAEEPEKLKQKIGFGIIAKSEEDAIKKATKLAGKNGTILITGSIYIVGKAYKYFGIEC